MKIEKTFRMSQPKGKFEIYSASAGAGKTYALVKNYLKICLDSDNPMRFREILAITFTNKAANEMKQRIVKQLEAFSSYTDDGLSVKPELHSMHGELAKELKVSVEKVSYRSREVLSNILHNYSAFSVSTIDKFTNRLIRSFAQDLKLSANYEVELDTGEMLSQAIDRMLADLDENSVTSKVLLEFINLKLEEGKSPRPEMSLRQMGFNLFDEGAIPFLKKLKGFDAAKIMEGARALQKEKARMEAEAKALATQLMDLIHASSIERMDFSRGTVYDYINRIAEGNFDKWPPNDTVLKALKKGEFYAKTKAKTLQGKFAPVEGKLLQGLKQLVDSTEELYPRHHIIKQVLKSIYSLATLTEIETNLEAVKEESNKLPIGEFNKLISEKLDNEPTAYLFEKLGERYHFFFIDEFQDTSVLQWKNLLPLINNAMASSGSVMIVGDGKQSIYRWRGGEVSQFIDLINDQDVSNKIKVGEELRELYSRKNVNLGSNYRSRKNVVEFNNHFFSTTGAQLMPGERFAELYRQATQNVERKDGGYVYLKQFEYTTEDYEQQQAEETLRIIRDAQERGYDLKDITIITRRRQETGLLAEYLVNKNIPVVSPDSLIISQSHAVQAVVSFLRILVRPDDLASRWPLAEWLWKINQPQLSFKEKHQFINHFVHLPKDELQQYLQEILKDYNFKRLSELSFTDKLYEISSLLQLTIQINPFLHTFIDKAIDYQRHKNDGEAGFLRWWDEHGSEKSINLPEGVEAVNLMTVHKSKGLEFSITIVPFADWVATREPMGSSAWFDLNDLGISELPAAKIGLKDDKNAFELYNLIYQNNRELVYLDNLNLAYVAFTRAVDELYVLGSRGRRDDNSRLSIYISEYLQTNVEEGDSMAVGTPKKKEKPEAQQASDQLRKYNQARWYDKLQIAVDAPLNWLTGETGQTSYGKKVHSLMALIQSHSQAGKVLAQQKKRGFLSEQELEELSPVVKGLLTDEVLEPYFKDGLEVFNEDEILLPNSKTARPDRVVSDGKNFHIIDYKTGAVMERHKDQVDSYRALLIQMGYPDGDNVLVYFGEEPEVIKW